jgi:hypothetical protein
MKNQLITVLILSLKLLIIGSYIASELQMKKHVTFNYWEIRRTRIKEQINQPTNTQTIVFKSKDLKDNKMSNNNNDMPMFSMFLVAL